MDNLEPEIIEIDAEHANNDDEKMQCIFTWRIKNYSDYQSEANEAIRSPVFTADSSSQWHLLLFPKDPTEYVSICVIPLTRIETNQEKIACEISILDYSSEKWCSEKKMQNLASFGHFEFQNFILKSQLITEKSKLLLNDTLTICCQMCTFKTLQLNNENSIRTVNEQKHLKFFSHDFRKLLGSGKFNDVTLILKDGTILAHKVILAARSTEFARIFESPNANEIRIAQFEKRTINDILSYIYTGEMHFSCSGGNLDLFQTAKQFRLDELEHWIAPTRIFAQTEVISGTYSYKWFLQNFTRITQNSGRMMYSRKFHTAITETWIISLCFNHNRGTDDIGIYLNKLRGENQKNSVFVQFQIYVLDKEKQPHFKIEMEGNFKPISSSHGKSSFLKKSILFADKKNLLPDDTLTICCEMHVFDGTSQLKILRTLSSSTNNKFGMSEISHLSDCFRKLFYSKAKADVCVCCSSKKFYLHKVILSARSPIFCDFFSDQSTNLTQFTININDIRPQVLEILFLLIYTGEIENLTDENANELYSAAKYYKIAGIQETFCNFLLSSLTTDNALKRMIISTEMGNQILKSLILDFICCHAEECINNPEWASFMRDHPIESAEISECLGTQYRRSTGN